LDPVRHHAFSFRLTACVSLHSVDASSSRYVPSVLQSPGDFDRLLMLVVVQLYK